MQTVRFSNVENNVLDILIPMLKRFEGLRLRPYLCSAGVPTIGYGATFYQNGKRVTMRDAAITRQEADELLRWHVTKYFLPDVLRLCPTANTPGRIAALTDFAFNLGLGALQRSTLRKRVNENRWDDVPGELRKWNRAGGVVLRGLTIRREAEASLI